MRNEIVSVIGKTFEFRCDNPSVVIDGQPHYVWRAGDRAVVMGLVVQPLDGGTQDNPVMIFSREGEPDEYHQALFDRLGEVINLR